MSSAGPSSSVAPAIRPSQNRIDGSGPGSSSSSRPRTDKRRAANLLRDYYGLSSDSSSTPQSPSIGDEAGTSDVLNPQVDLHSLLRSNSLSVLLGKESELIVQIRELDGERQSLVYNHHHELVAASDTIRNMKNRSESLDPSLDSLKSSFETMSNLSSHLEVLRSSSSKAAKESSSDGIDSLHDLEPIVTLPATLSDLIECRFTSDILTAKADAAEPDVEARKAGLAQAEHLWGTMEPVLAAWTDAGVAGVREIAAECRGLLKEGRKTVEFSAPTRV
ncbi:uncharacterized protein UTRI_05602 [Ustilago trichophora]|uniref:Vacuolar protein sorting-associated protein 51 homolog n=1 Tax=Ustilago trichophora TaxID=86804 RepID=A0A5C3EEX4_9BASI|nr:uncharacterized protein UTRI_05602 [Ustilago trichophora]